MPDARLIFVSAVDLSPPDTSQACTTLLGQAGLLMSFGSDKQQMWQEEPGNLTVDKSLVPQSEMALHK